MVIKLPRHNHIVDVRLSMVMTLHSMASQCSEKSG
uniref:Uncharacterized protein n=1 Tax=Arundo donax TaxID=35708 RepID=A0A0A9ANX7_ARUDO